MRIIIFLFSFIYIQLSYSQQLTGIVFELDDKGVEIPAAGVKIQLKNTKKGAVTNAEGKFTIPTADTLHQLIISYTGYKNDTVEGSIFQPVRVVLSHSAQLADVAIVGKTGNSYFSKLNTIGTETLTTGELGKAACCNLSESFETNGTVDVSFTDAVSGAKQIQMLGLSGNYVQLLTEKAPFVRGLASTYGLNQIPGPWVESIQVSKGVGSVTTGYESITGQINVQIKDPEHLEEKLFLNAYFNHIGRMEGNAIFAHKFNEKWATMLLLHGNQLENQVDMNNDHFLDLPLVRGLSALNRWSFAYNNGMEGQLGVKYIYENRQGGQINFHPPQEIYTHNNYGVGIETKRGEFFAKTGYVFPNNCGKSIGMITSAYLHEQNSYFGYNHYVGKEKQVNWSLLYQTNIVRETHKLTTGASFLYNDFNERFWNNNVDTNYLRTEIVPGAFAEYTFTKSEDFTIVAGVRGDFHNLYGFKTVPRLHIRYALIDNTILRISGGKGWRVANIFAENTNILATSRRLIIQEKLLPEVAWNGGTNLTQNLTLFDREGSIRLDYYYTQFENQLIIDLDQNPQEVNIYNLKGQSFSHALQIELNYEIIKNLHLKTAYKWYDIRATYHNELLTKPLVAKNRVLVNIGYEFRKWKFDWTLHWFDSQRLPNTKSNPIEYQVATYSPRYTIMNAQITHTFKKLEIYLGGENLANFRQLKPIIAPNDPFGQYFDSSIVWAPIMGRMIYLGARWSLK